MPVSAAKLAKGADLPGEFTYADELVHFTYNPGAITGATIREALELADSAMAGAGAATSDAERKAAIQAAQARGFVQLCEQLPTFITSWDVLEREPRKGERIDKVPRLPITTEKLLGLPVAFVYALSNAVQGAQNPPDGSSFAGG